MQFSGLYPRVKNSLLWAQFWITLFNFELSTWLWGVEFALRTLGCQSRVSEGLGTMFGWPGSQHKPCPEAWALGGTAMRTGSWELGGDAKAQRARGNSAAHFADGLSCTHFRWMGDGLCGFVLVLFWFCFGFFETQKGVGLIASPFWMAASVPWDHLCRTQWEP